MVLFEFINFFIRILDKGYVLYKYMIKIEFFLVIKMIYLEIEFY